MPNQTPKKPCQTAVTTRYLLMPHHANPQGTAFGGVIMSWIDAVASMAAQRHAGNNVVTAFIDQISFRQPINIGDHVLLKACVNYVGKTSMEVGVQVTKEDPYTGDSTVATTAYLTFVAVDKSGKPTAIPPLDPATDAEKRRFANAAKRVERRKAEKMQPGS